jgi:hypothetical protein
MTQKRYAIKYLGRGHTIDFVDARSKKDALRKVVVLDYFVAEEVKDKLKGEIYGRKKANKKSS